MAKEQAGKKPAPRKTTKKPAAAETQRVGIAAHVLEEIAAERTLILATGQAKRGTEHDLVRQFLESHSAKQIQEVDHGCA